MGKPLFDLSVVVATRNRLPELRRMLRSLESQSLHLREIIVVDGSDNPIEGDLEEFGNLPIRYVRCFPPSTAKQRNEGVKKVSSNPEFIAFLDDDIVLEPEAMAAMREFWLSSSAEIGGAAFNLLNHPKPYAPKLKSSWAAERLGLYSRTGGKILPSGFHTMIGCVQVSTRVEWLTTGAVIWRSGILQGFRFDEWFRDYSYLEDLDFSLQVNKRYQLWVVGDAGYFHYPGLAGRGNDFQFGRREVLNRVYLVKKHKALSLRKCKLALILRLAINLSLAVKRRSLDRLDRTPGSMEENINYLMRALGNAVGLMQTIFHS
jgi:glycosyltransferase involved in cell wall biosynthesis